MTRTILRTWGFSGVPVLPGAQILLRHDPCIRPCLCSFFRHSYLIRYRYQSQLRIFLLWLCRGDRRLCCRFQKRRIRLKENRVVLPGVEVLCVFFGRLGDFGRRINDRTVTGLV
ncbi:hypothetical protein [Roseovarius sp.]|uniref:hypothetical protein n=1 Tax=Roseovarius sp. TaxID=1486281 RepID=UPI002623E458|nr:hypothetical protein [Roseovarius sp.]